jgi:hypothetical protein
MKYLPEPRRCWALAILAVIALPGCGSNVAPPAARDTNLESLARLYGMCTGQMGRPPASAEELKSFIAQMPAGQRQAMGVADAEKLFISPRDNQPYVVRWGQGGGAPGASNGSTQPASTGETVIAYEKIGFEGKRFVAFDIGRTEEVDDARFRELVPNP